MQNFRLKVDQDHYNMSEPTIFSGGEIHIDISHMPNHCNDYTLKARCQSSEDIMHMFMLLAACYNRWPQAHATLVIPYLPYARQDRVCADGQAFSLRTFTALLGQADIDTFVTYDVHSQVSTDLLNAVFRQHQVNVKVIRQDEVLSSNTEIREMIQDHKVRLVSPDKGAVNKVKRCATYNGAIEPLFCTKTRDPSTGWLVTDAVEEDLSGQDLLIIDDICDGGATFINLAKELKKAGANSVALYVTHGIFSKGFDCFQGLVDTIYTTDSFRRNDSYSNSSIVMSGDLTLKVFKL